MRKFAHLAISFLFGITTAAIMAYTLAHTAHYYLGVPGSALREQALISAALIFALVATALLTSRD
jgi:hypothetical protein